jgi:hypothetical protein
MIGTSDRVSLPIGIDKNGQRYREVVIDEMTGIDEENLASPKARNNASKAVTLLLRRCIQEIPGVLPRKNNPMSLCDESIIRDMFVADRDFLMLCIRALSSKPEISMNIFCNSCASSQEVEVSLETLDVYEWDDSPAELSIEMPKGFHDQLDGQYKNKMVWGFPRGKDQEKVAQLPPHQAGSGVIVATLKSVENMDHMPTIEDVRRLPLRDRQVIAETITDNHVGVANEAKVSCPSCSAENTVEVDFTGFFSLDTHKTQKRVNAGTSGRKLRKRL